MAKKKGNVYGQVVVYEKKFKGTSIGKNPKKVNSMNKHKRQGRSRKQLRYRGQGRWNDQASILMVSLYLIKCHKILDHHKVEVHVEIVDSIQDLIHFVESIEQKVLKILMFATSGDQDILKDNGTYNTKWWCLYSCWGY